MGEIATYRNVHTSFWQDAFVLDLTPEEKYFYLYIMTNSKTTQCGVYEIPKKVMELETGYNRETVDKLLNRFVEYGKVEYCEETKEMLIKNWLKYNSSKSPKIMTCIEREVSEIKCRRFKKYCIDTLCIDLGEEEEEEREEEEEKEEKKQKPVRHKYGLYENVLLSDTDMEKLVKEFTDYQERVERLSEYIASTGKSYKNHLATIRSWARKDTDKKKGNPFDELLRKELANDQNRNNSPDENNKRVLPDVLPGRGND